MAVNLDEDPLCELLETWMGPKRKWDGHYTLLRPLERCGKKIKDRKFIIPHMIKMDGRLAEFEYKILSGRLKSCSGVG
jgi:hypothetical protein